jgi:hypothetical protein
MKSDDVQRILDAVTPHLSGEDMSLLRKVSGLGWAVYESGITPEILSLYSDGCDDTDEQADMYDTIDNMLVGLRTAIEGENLAHE